MMKTKRYCTHFAKLSNLILSMSEEQQAKLLYLAMGIKIRKPTGLQITRNGPDSDLDYKTCIRMTKIGQ